MLLYFMTQISTAPKLTYTCIHKTNIHV